MNRSIAIAWAIAGIATSIAVVTVVGNTSGLDRPPDPTPITPAPIVTPTRPGQAPEITYVDKRGRPVPPPSASRARYDHDDDDEHEEHEAREHRGRRDHDDD